MWRVILSYPCPYCGFDNRKPVGILGQDGDAPLVPFDIAAQETVYCDCGRTLVTGDFELIDQEDL